MAQDFVHLLASKTAPLTAGYTMNPIQQREAMLKDLTDRQKAELMAKAMGTSGQIDEQMVDNWLRMKNTNAPA